MTTADHTRINLAVALHLAAVRARQHADALASLYQRVPEPDEAERAEIGSERMLAVKDADRLDALARSYGYTP